MDLTKVGRLTRATETGSLTSETSETWLGNVAGRDEDKAPYWIQQRKGADMKARRARFGAAVLGCAAAIVSCVAVASADPQDPHLPDLANNYCPGAQWTYGSLVSVDGGSGQRRMCDGVLYPDGSYWHEWTWERGVPGTEWHHDCVTGSSAFPAPPPPGGCAGAIPPA